MQLLAGARGQHYWRCLALVNPEVKRPEEKRKNGSASSKEEAASDSFVEADRPQRDCYLALVSA